MTVQRSAGAIVLVNTGQNGLQVALQRRGKNDSYPGACQVTVHGKCEEGENFFATLIRESNEELGSKFTDLCLDEAHIQVAHRRSYGDKEIMTYYLFIREEYLKLIELEKTSGGIELVPAYKFYDNSVVEITPERKKRGYPKSTIAMFPDEIIAIKSALEQQT